MRNNNEANKWLGSARLGSISRDDDRLTVRNSNNKWLSQMIYSQAGWPTE